MAKSVKKAAKKTATKKSTPKKIVKKSPVKAVAKLVKKTMVKVAKKATKPALKKAAKALPKKAAVKKPVKRSVPSPEPTKGKRFLLIYHAPIDAMTIPENLTPEQQAAGMAMWQAWAERCGSKLLDMGAPLVNGRRLGAAGDPTPSGREVSGYSILSAEDWDDIMSLVDGHPHLSGWNPDATLEIHETMLIPGM